MQSVSRFEANLLHLLYYFLRQEPGEWALPLVDRRLDVPACLSRNAVRLVQEALARGCMLLLARRGGWRSERHLRGEQMVEGRLWQRTKPEELGLTFSGQTLEFLIWITAARPGDSQPSWHAEEAQLTIGDLLLLFFAHEGLRALPEGLANAVRDRDPFLQHGLCRLAFPEDFVSTPASSRPSFTPWLTGLGACLLEALQRDLAERWIHVESGKERCIDPAAMQHLGQAQELVLTSFLDAVEKVGRFDLARFLLRAAAHLLGPHAHAGMLTRRLQTSGLRLMDRARTYLAACAFLRQLPRLQRWERQARSIGYFDEGYAAGQLWKLDWDRYEGDTLAARAQAIVSQLDPMRQTTADGEAQAT